VESRTDFWDATAKRTMTPACGNLGYLCINPTVTKCPEAFGFRLHPANCPSLTGRRRFHHPVITVFRDRVNALEDKQTIASEIVGCPATGICVGSFRFARKPSPVVYPQVAPAL
jgi:hypothetical protein